MPGITYRRIINLISEDSDLTTCSKVGVFQPLSDAQKTLKLGNNKTEKTTFSY